MNLLNLTIILLVVILAVIVVRVIKRFIMASHPAIKDPVPGVLHVTGCSYPDIDAMYGKCTIVGVVEAKGSIPAAPFNREILVKRSKWPQPGMELPVVIDRQDHEQVKILWDQVEDMKQQAARQAQQMADAINKKSR